MFIYRYNRAMALLGDVERLLALAIYLVILPSVWHVIDVYTGNIELV